MGIGDGILHRPHKTHPQLPEHLLQRNKMLAKIRCRVETTFAIWKRHYGFWRVRYYGLARNQTQLTLLAIATNLKRMVVLTT